MKITFIKNGHTILVSAFSSSRKQKGDVKKTIEMLRNDGWRVITYPHNEEYIKQLLQPAENITKDVPV